MAPGPRPDRRRPPGLTEEDLALWRHATRADVRLPGRDYADFDFAGETIVRRPPPSAAGPAKPAAPAPLPPPGALDRRTAQRIRRGRLAIEARLDLHGLTQAEAHRALNQFLADAQAAEKRCVLVITGKGGRAGADEDWRASETGVLRRAVPHWLAQPPNRTRVIATQAAHARHGGDGALYVLLRRPRP